MPANLPPTYHAAEARLRRAVGAVDKIAILEEMLAIIPKHKGTDKLQADLKRRISKLRNQQQKKSATAHKGYDVTVKSEGAAQIALVGTPNSGKSTILNQCTNAESEVATYPFTTRRPVCGMMYFEHVPLQLVDLPPLSNDYMEYWVPNIIRNADRLALVLNITTDPLVQIELIQSILERSKMRLAEQGEKERVGSIAVKRSFFVITHVDGPREEEDLAALLELLETELPFVTLSTKRPASFDRFPEFVFNQLDLIRVYTKAPGKEADITQPFLLERDSTVLDLARSIHKEMEHTLKFARVWGSSKFAGQKMPRDAVLQDKDIVELQTI